MSNTRERETRAPTHPTRHPRWMSLFHAAAITDADLPTPVPSRSPTADIISAVEFDKTGEHLATGDRGGRVVLFDSKSRMLSAPLLLCCLPLAPSVLLLIWQPLLPACAKD